MKKILLLLLSVIVIAGCSRHSDNTPDKIIITHGNLQCVAPSSQLPKPLTVEVLGVLNKGLLGGKGTRNPIANIPIDFVIYGNNTNIFFPEGNQALTDEGGKAFVPVTVGKTVGDIYVHASFTKKDGQKRSVEFRLTSGITLANDKQETFANRTCDEPLEVKVFTPEGNSAKDIDVYFSVEGGSKKAKLSDSHVKTDENGIAKTYVTPGKKTGAIKIVAEVVDAQGNSLTRSMQFTAMGLNHTSLIVALIGGLAIFIFGMKVMSEGLQRVAGAKMKSILQFFTKNKVVGVMAGAGVTAVIQSSSACTVMVVGFVNAGLLTLNQAVGIVFGSNIGTTITAQIIAFKLTKLALPAIIIGLVIQMTGRRNTTKFWGQVLLGFGLLFFGMMMMSDTLRPLRTSPTFMSFFHGFDCSPVNGFMPITSVLWAVFIGTVLTVVVQSSSATVGLTMALAGSGLLNFYTAVPIILGDNIGTTITANLAAIGGTRTARRTALVHTLFNVIGTSVMLGLFYIPMKGIPIFLYYVNKFTSGNVFANPPVNIARHIAMAHSTFNIICVVALLPFSGFLAWISKRIVPVLQSEKEETLQYLEPHLLQTPSLAIGQATRELAYMTRRSVKMVEDSYRCLKENNLKWENDILRREEIVDDLQEKISNYLAKLTAMPLTEREAAIVPVLVHAVQDAEQIGDLAVGLVKLAERRNDKKIVLSDEALDDIKEMFEAVDLQCDHVFNGLNTGNEEEAKFAMAFEDKIKFLSKRLSGRCIKSFDPEKENVNQVVFVLDIIANFERIGSRLINIAERIPALSEFEMPIE